jgi:hypothetical protein
MGLTALVSLASGAETRGWKVARPFSDAERVGFIAVSGEESEDVPEQSGLRLKLIENLPRKTLIVIYVQSLARAEALRALYRGLANADRIRYLLIPGGAPDSPNETGGAPFVGRR